MNVWIKMAVVAMMAVAAPACVQGVPEDGDPDQNDGDPTAVDQDTPENSEDVGEAEQAVECQLNWVAHYTYSDSEGSFKWNVSYNFTTGKWYVDERRIGGGFYRQYVLTPGWTVCPSSPETISLKYGGATQTGPHNCLPDLREEVHLDKQRVLSRTPTNFITYECSY